MGNNIVAESTDTHPDIGSTTLHTGTAGQKTEESSPPARVGVGRAAKRRVVALLKGLRTVPFFPLAPRHSSSASIRVQPLLVRVEVRLLLFHLRRR